MKKNALIPLAALAALGAGCSGAPAQPEEPATYQAIYLEGARLEFEAEIGGETVRKYTERNDWDHIYTYIEVVKEDGSTVIYADNDWSTASNYSSKELDEVVFIEGDEILKFANYKAMEIIEGEKIEYPEPGYSWSDFGVPVLERAQERFDEYLEKIGAYEKQQDQAYYDSTLLPLQQWALERLVASEPVLPTPEPVVEEPVEAEPVEPAPEPVNVGAREISPYLLDNYLNWSALVSEEQTGRALMRKYVSLDISEITTYLVVDQADGTSLFFSDWQRDGELDSFAITGGGQTVFFEKFRMLFISGEEEPAILNKTPPGAVWDEARKLFDHYRSFASPEKEDQYSAEEMENWALGELGED